jgi:RimJ/RimL family protein N-acetyltransferase
LFEAGHTGGSNETIWNYLPYGPFADVKEMQRWLRECAISSDPLWFAVRETENDSLIGMTSFMEIRPQIGVGEIGHIWFGCCFHRSRALTEALFSMIRHIFSDCHYRRLEWKCDALNKPSRYAALRLGFRYEGTFYNHKIVKGRNRDTAWYSIVDTEWSPLRVNFERWLNPGNFDESARQRSSLGQMNRSLWLHT